MIMENGNERYDGPQVRLCEDGAYRWTYPVNMLKKPVIYLTVCKIFGIIGAVAFVTGYIREVIRGDFAAIVHDLKYWGIAVLVFLAISALAYLVVAAIYGGRYVVRFTMDEKGITHEQLPAQQKKARGIGKAVAAGGALAGNVGRVGQGMLVASHTSLSSDFSKVRRIRPQRLWNTIKVNEPFAKNQVYTTREDFDFVLGFIRSHCPQAK